MKLFRHAVERGSIPTVNILGVEIAALDMQRLLAFTEEHVKELSGDYICVSNVHTTVMAYEDPEYRAIQNGGMMAIPDGGPLSAVGRKRGYEMSRTTGPDYMAEMIRVSGKKGYRHYFYGSTAETLGKLRERLAKEEREDIIAGMESPPFRPLTAEEDRAAMARINEAGADFVWVGLGAPKQERWMAEHQGKVRGLMVGVGAAFDYYAGNIRRAPEWMQRMSLEWLYRLMQDPRRLFRRYFVTNMKFIWHAVIRGR